MKHLRQAVVAVATVGLLVGCGMSLPDDKKDYAGVWEHPNMYLEISPGGRVEYEREEAGSRSSVEAPLKGFDGDNFDVGIWFLSTTFVVTKPPHELDGAWHMTVDGLDLVRIDR